MATSPSSTITQPRPDIRDTLMKFDLQANQAGFVGLAIAPVLEVEEAFGEYPVIEPGDLLKDNVQTLRNNDGTYNFVGGKVGKDTYRTEEHGIGERVDDREATIYRSWFSAESLAAERARNVVLQAHNNRVIALATGLGAGQQTAAGTAWTNTGSSDPIANVRTACIAIRDRIGMAMNLWMVIDWNRLQYLKDNGAILERIKYAGFQDPEKNEIGIDALRSVLGLDGIIVSNSMKNTAIDPNAATFTESWTETLALIFVRSTGRNLRSPQFMRTFHWGADGSMIGGVIESYGDSTRRSDIVRVRMETDEKLVYGGCGQLITGI